MKGRCSSLCCSPAQYRKPHRCICALRQYKSLRVLVLTYSPDLLVRDARPYVLASLCSCLISEILCNQDRTCRHSLLLFGTPNTSRVRYLILNHRALHCYGKHCTAACLLFSFKARRAHHIDVCHKEVQHFIQF